jgi:hypothetical protein
MDSLTTCTHNSELQVITVPSLISTIHKSPQHPLSLFQPSVLSPAISQQQLRTVGIFQLHAFIFCLQQPPMQNSAELTASPSYLQDNSSAWTTQKTQPFCCCRGMFTMPLHSNGCGVDNIENTPFAAVSLLLHAYSLLQECDY